MLLYNLIIFSVYAVVFLLGRFRAICEIDVPMVRMRASKQCDMLQ